MALVYWLQVGALALPAMSAATQPDGIEALDYESEAPLGIQERSTEMRQGVLIRDISFTSPMGGEVPAFVVAPPGEGPFAGIVFLHWGEGDRSEFLAEAILLARAGTASVLISAPFVRTGDSRRSWNEAEGYVQMVVDCRRAVDVLESVPGVDAERIAYVGHSLGATWGGAMAVGERRFKFRRCLRRYGLQCRRTE